MEKIRLLAIGEMDPKIEWKIVNGLEGENGFENNYCGCSYDKYINEIRPRYIKDAKGEDLPDGHVPQTTMILYLDDEPVGYYKVRHFCNDVTRVNGAGHIGYALRKEYRGRGLATAGLKLAIEALIKMPDYKKEEGVIMGYHKDNPASGKVQEKCGAVIIGETEDSYISQIKIK